MKTRLLRAWAKFLGHFWVDQIVIEENSGMALFSPSPSKHNYHFNFLPYDEGEFQSQPADG